MWRWRRRLKRSIGDSDSIFGFIQLVTVCLGHIGICGPLAQLQSAGVCGDGAAVGRLHLSGIVRHASETIADHVIKPAKWRIFQPLYVEGRRTLIAALHNHSVSITHHGMAW